MSKRNRIVERASDVNGGQYIQTNPSYNSGYEDGKKAGKEYCASEIEALREQVEKLTKERDDLRSRRCEVCGYLEHEREHTGCLREQLAALAEQNEKLKEATNLIYSWANNWDSEFMNDPDWLEQDYPFIQSTISLPDLASPVLNRIRAEGMRMASTFISLVRNGWASAGDNLSVQAAEYIISALDARAAELEKS